MKRGRERERKRGSKGNRGKLDDLLFFSWYYRESAVAAGVA